MKILIIGGTGFIGKEIVNKCIENSHELTVLSLDEPHTKDVKWIKINRNDIDSIRNEFTHLTFDVIIDNIAYKPFQIEIILNILGHKIKKYILTSTIDIYNHPFPVKAEEDLHIKTFFQYPKNLEHYNYITNKRDCENILLDADFDFDKIILRPAIVVGRNDNSVFNNYPYSRSMFFPIRIMDKNPIFLWENDHRLHQIIHVKDLVNAYIQCINSSNVHKEIFNVVNDEVFTNEKFIHELSQSVNLESSIIRITREELNKLDSKITYRYPYYVCTSHKWSLFSNDKLKRIGWNPTPIKFWGTELFDNLKIDSIDDQRLSEISAAKKLKPKTKHTAQESNLDHTVSLSGIKISKIGIGTHHGTTDYMTNFKYANSLMYSIKNGINVIDTAINYRNMQSELTIGQVLNQLHKINVQRKNLFVVSKGGFLPKYFTDTISVRNFKHRFFLSDYELQHKHSIKPEYIDLSLSTSIANLGSYIDGYLLHNPEISIIHNRNDFYESLIKTFALLEQRVNDKSIRFYGISSWKGLSVNPNDESFLDIEKIIKCSEIAAGGKSFFKILEIPLNLYTPDVFLVKNQANSLKTVIEYATDRELLVLSSHSIYHGKDSLSPDIKNIIGDDSLSSNQEKILNVTKNIPGVSCALVGLREIEHVISALKVLNNKNGLSVDQINQILKISCNKQFKP